MRLPFLQRHPRVALLRLSGLIAARSGGFAPSGISAEAIAPLLERAFAIVTAQPLPPWSRLGEVRRSA